MKREQKILVLDLINVGDQHRNNGEKDPYFSLVYLLGTEYSSLDAVISTQKKKKSLEAIIAWIIQGQLCGRVMKMGCILMETSKMVELDSNLRNNCADPHLAMSYSSI